MGKCWKNPRKFTKNIRKYPQLPKMAENVKNVWENYVINAQKIQIRLKKYLKLVENSHGCLIRPQTQKVPSKAG